MKTIEQLTQAVLMARAAASAAHTAATTYLLESYDASPEAKAELDHLEAVAASAELDLRAAEVEYDEHWQAHVLHVQHLPHHGATDTPGASHG